MDQAKVNYLWPWSKVRLPLINLHIWPWSKLFEHIQKLLKAVKKFWTMSKYFWTSRWKMQYVELVAHFVTSIGDQIPKTKWPRYLLLFFVAVAIQNRNKETAWPLLCSSLMNFAFCIYEFFSPIILNFDPLRKSKQILSM